MISGDERFETFDVHRHAIDDWSRAVHAALRIWPVAEHGTWRFRQGALELVSGSDGTRTFAPISVSTADDELTLSLDLWHAHIPSDIGSAEAASAVVAQVADWLDGRMVVLWSSDRSGAPVAVGAASAADLREQLANFARMRRCARIEVRRASGVPRRFAVKRRLLGAPRLVEAPLA